MINLRPRVLAESDQHHLVQARFDVAHEAGVRLDSTRNQNVVGLRSMLVEVHRDPLRCVIDDDGLHRGPDLAAHCLGSDAVSCENPRLSLGRSASVASHRRHDERHGTQTFNMLDHRASDLPDVRDPTTPCRDRHRLPRADRLTQLERRQLRLHLRRDIRHSTSIELLTNTNHAREGHDLPILE